VPPSPEHKCVFYKLLTRPFAINLFSFFENELKLTYGNVEFQNFPGFYLGPPYNVLREDMRFIESYSVSPQKTHTWGRREALG